ncbi:alpha/beta fold hydrolase [Streptomyces hypolithicus]
MPFFSAHDGTDLAYHVFGDAGGGEPLVCLPGGPMQASVYLGELGGLSAHRQLIVFDLRGTGLSPEPHDAADYRCDRLVDDVEALREHLGLDRMDLLAHSAAANLAALYVARHPQRISKLALITPSTKAVAIEVSAETRRETAQLRRDEPWFAGAFAALESIMAGEGTDANWKAMAPFSYGRWDAAARAHQAAEDGQRNQEAADAFGADGAFDPDTTRAALAGFRAPVLLVAGEVDLSAIPGVVAEYAELFPNARLVVQPAAGHFPWLDDAERFVASVSDFLR